MNEYNPHIWGTYKEKNDFWDVYRHPTSKEKDSGVKPIPLTIFEAKQVQEEYRPYNSTLLKYWVEEIN